MSESEPQSDPSIHDFVLPETTPAASSDFILPGEEPSPLARRTEEEPSTPELNQRINRLDFAHRLERAQEDPDVQAGLLALRRTLFNAAITWTDFTPVLGEAASGVADAAKLAAHWLKHHKNTLDLTPDLPTKSVLLDLLQPFCLGFAPIHGILGFAQLTKDFPRMQKALQTLKDKWDNDFAYDQDPELQRALATFEEENHD